MKDANSAKFLRNVRAGARSEKLLNKNRTVLGARPGPIMLSKKKTVLGAPKARDIDSYDDLLRRKKKKITGGGSSKGSDLEFLIRTDRDQETPVEDRPKRSKRELLEDEDDTPKLTPGEIKKQRLERKRRIKNAPAKLDKLAKSTALVVTGKKDGLQRATKGMIEASFGDNASRIIEMIEMNNTDGGMTLLKKKLLQTSIDLLTFAEAQVRTSNSAKGVYQFSTMVSQIRELIGDIEADRDRDLLINSIDDRVLRPNFIDMAQKMVTKHYDFRKLLERSVKPDKVQTFNEDLKELSKQLAQVMQEHYDQILEGISLGLKN